VIKKMLTFKKKHFFNIFLTFFKNIFLITLKIII
jgi:hypothetical protein